MERIVDAGPKVLPSFSSFTLLSSRTFEQNGDMTRQRKIPIFLSQLSFLIHVVFSSVDGRFFLAFFFFLLLLYCLYKVECGSYIGWDSRSIVTGKMCVIQGCVTEQEGFSSLPLRVLLLSTRPGPSAKDLWPRRARSRPWNSTKAELAPVAAAPVGVNENPGALFGVKVCAMLGFRSVMPSAAFHFIQCPTILCVFDRDDDLFFPRFTLSSCPFNGTIFFSPQRFLPPRRNWLARLEDSCVCLGRLDRVRSFYTSDFEVNSEEEISGNNVVIRLTGEINVSLEWATVG